MLIIAGGRKLSAKISENWLKLCNYHVESIKNVSLNNFHAFSIIQIIPFSSTPPCFCNFLAYANIFRTFFLRPSYNYCNLSFLQFLHSPVQIKFSFGTLLNIRH